MSSIDGKDDLKLSGTNFDSIYSDIPMGWLLLSNEYCASIVFLVLQISKPIESGKLTVL
jgi:hypothetical protein